MQIVLLAFVFQPRLDHEHYSLQSVSGLILSFRLFGNWMSAGSFEHRDRTAILCNRRVNLSKTEEDFSSKSFIQIIGGSEIFLKFPIRNLLITITSFWYRVSQVSTENFPVCEIHIVNVWMFPFHCQTNVSIEKPSAFSIQLVLIESLKEILFISIWEPWNLSGSFRTRFQRRIAL